MSTEYTLPAGFPQPTIYASLMDRSVKQPLSDWNTTVTEKVSAILSSLEEMGLTQLRAAYVAGVADGYRQALIELEQADGVG